MEQPSVLLQLKEVPKEVMPKTEPKVLSKLTEVMPKTEPKELSKLTKLMPKTVEDLIDLATKDDTDHIIEDAVLKMLRKCAQALYQEHDYKTCVVLSDILIDYVWEQLNTGYWKDVSLFWRYCYTIISMMKMFSQTALLVDKSPNVTFADVMKTCDMGLLMGAPLLDNVLAKMSTCASKLFRESSDNVEEAKSSKPKKAKLSSDTHSSHSDNLINLDQSKLIQRHSCPSLESFQKLYLTSRVPVIITDSIDFWPAMSTRRWSLEYIKSIAGTRTVPIELGSKYTEDSWSQKLMTISEFIENHIENKNVCTGDGENVPKGYLAQHQLFDQIPELQNDFSVPEFCCLGSKDDVAINAWFGPHGTVSPLHYDDKDNLLTQVMGKKYIRLYSDEYNENVYPHPHRLLHNTSQVDIEQPDFEKFPNFKSAPYLECILNPGEMLFIPAKFWHFVKSLSVSFSLSFWWE